MLVARPEDRVKQAELDTVLAALKKDDAVRKAKADKDFAAWRAQASPSSIVAKELPAGWKFDAETPLTVKTPTGPALTAKAIGKPAYNKKQGGFVLDGSSAYEHATLGDFEKTQAWAVQVRLKMTKTTNGAVLARMDEGNNYRGWDFWIENGNPVMHIIQTWPDQALKVRSAGAIPVNKEVEIIATYDGSGKPEGVKFYIDGDLQKNLVDTNTLPANATIRTTTPFRYGTRSKAGATSIVLVSANIIRPWLKPVTSPPWARSPNSAPPSVRKAPRPPPPPSPCCGATTTVASINPTNPSWPKSRLPRPNSTSLKVAVP